MIRRVTSSRRLLRKRMYRSPHSRHRVPKYFRENKNKAKPHQEEFKKMNGPQIKPRRRPKREVIEGFKMSYRYKYYMQGKQEETDEEELEE